MPLANQIAEFFDSLFVVGFFLMELNGYVPQRNIHKNMKE